MVGSALKIGTRASAMARAVAQSAKGKLQAALPDQSFEVHPFQSDGCRFGGDLKLLGGKGAFTKNLEERLLRGEIDCAIHALKDMPGHTEINDQLQVVAYLRRDDARDVLIMRPGIPVPKIGESSSLVIGTSAPRRTALLHRLFPGIKVIPLRGNVDSRFVKLESGDFDAMVLSVAGLGYLGLSDRASKILEADEMLPAVGQGVLCMQVRRADVERLACIRQVLNDPKTEIAARAERAILLELTGDCHSAIAGYCEINGNELTVRGLVASPDGATILQKSATGSVHEPESAGVSVARALIADGALALMGRGA